MEATEPRTSVGSSHAPKVLDEDTYVAALDSIIQRDFFPELPRLRTQLDYLEALESEDPIVLQRAQQAATERLVEGRLATPRAVGSATPATGRVGITPAFETPRLPGGETPSVLPPPGAADKTQDGPVRTDLRLDQFQTAYTSEDNASFDIILEKQQEKEKERYWWIYKKEADEDDKKKLLLTYYPDDDVQEQDKPGALVPWDFKAKNAIYFPIDGCGQPTSKKNPRGPPKAIAYDNTGISEEDMKRIQGTISSEDGDEQQHVKYSMLGGPGFDQEQLREWRRAHEAEIQNGVAQLQRQQQQQQQQPNASPRVRGYGFVVTPSPAPGVDMSPFMTWGEVDGTPLLLDPFEKPAGFGPGPGQFLPPEPRSREEKAQELGSKATRSLAMKKAALSGGSASSRRRTLGAPLSNAGKRLLTAMERKGGVDPQLRASYGTPTRTPSRYGGTSTPGGTPFRSPLRTPRGTPLRTPSLFPVPPSKGRSGPRASADNK